MPDVTSLMWGEGGRLHMQHAVPGSLNVQRAEQLFSAWHDQVPGLCFRKYIITIAAIICVTKGSTSGVSGNQ